MIDQLLQILTEMLSNIATSGEAVIVISIAATAFGWLFKIAFEAILKWYNWRKKRKEALIFLMADVLTNKYNIREIFTQKNLNYMHDEIERDKKFRPYAVGYELEPAPENIVGYLASLPKIEIALISRYLMHSGLYKKYYENAISDEFAALPVHRKRSAFKHLSTMAERVEGTCDDLIPVLEKNHCYLKVVVQKYRELEKPKQETRKAQTDNL